MKFFKKIDTFYILTLFFLLLSSNANFLATENLYWFIALTVMITIAIAKKLISAKELRIIGLFSFIYLLFVTVRDIFVNDLDADFLTSDFLFLFKYIFFAYLYITILKKKTVTYVVEVMTDLTVLSFFFYLFQIIGLGDLLYQYSSGLNLTSNVNIDGYTNFIFFSFTKGLHDYANSGFVWEPGAFGCFLCITLLLHLLVSRFRFDRKSAILITGIITTFSTTAYLALLVMLFLAYRFRNPAINRWFFLLVPLFIGLLITIPFLGNKISDIYYADMTDLNRLTMLERYYHRHNTLIPLNRFASMNYISETFGNQLILGVSNKYDALMNKKLDVDISNGLFDFFAKFGIAGFLFLLFRYLQFCYAYTRRAEYLIYCALIFLTIGFGEPLLHLPIVLMFLFLANAYPAGEAGDTASINTSNLRL